jgi:SAM-dependent methyltransferase
LFFEIVFITKDRENHVTIKAWLSNPLTRGMDIDNPKTTELRRHVIQEKSFLRKIYLEWYSAIDAALPTGSGSVLEIGSGAGFMNDHIPDIITSDVFWSSGVNLVLDGGHLPFRDVTLRAIVMTNVFHHFPNPQRFLWEAARCVRLGGTIVMIEPWVTSWSRLIYSKLHHEPFSPEATEWEFPQRGPLSGANSALPWIIFQRDRKRFESEFPQWHIKTVKLMMPFSYIVSGGVSLRSLSPGLSYGLWRTLERTLRPLMPRLAMFAQIVLQKLNY